jgi:hypothetical protein
MPCFLCRLRAIGQALPDQSFEQITGEKKCQTLSIETWASFLDDLEIVQTVSAKLADRFTLGWTHYVIPEMSFYGS